MYRDHKTEMQQMCKNEKPPCVSSMKQMCKTDEMIIIYYEWNLYEWNLCEYV